MAILDDTVAFTHQDPFKLLAVLVVLTGEGRRREVVIRRVVAVDLVRCVLLLAIVSAKYLGCVLLP